MNRQIVSAILFLAGVLCSGNAWPATISVGDGAIRAGGTVNIAVIAAATVDLGGVNLRLEYNPTVFPSASVSPGALLNSSHVVKSNSPAAGKFNVAAYAPPGSPPLTGQTGTAFTIALKVSPTAATGEYPISFAVGGTPLLASSGLSDMSGTAIAHGKAPGSVTVFEALAADVNTDGDVTNADLIILLENWHESAPYPYPDGDINRNETVDEEDLMLLQKDWNVPPPALEP